MVKPPAVVLPPLIFVVLVVVLFVREKLFPAAIVTPVIYFVADVKLPDAAVPDAAALL